jgi:hypothetical protein
MTDSSFRGPYYLDPFQSIVQVNFPALDPVFLDGETWLSKPDGVACVDNGRLTLSVWFNGPMYNQFFYLFNPAADWTTGGQWITTAWATWMQAANYDPETFNSEQLSGNSSPTPDFSVSDNHWHHLLVSYDFNHPFGEKLLQCYIDDVQITSVVGDGVEDGGQIPAAIGALSGQRLDLFHNSIYDIFGGTPTTGEKVIAAVAEYWLAPGVYLDLDDVAIRRRFLSADGKPVKLGKNGEKPLVGTEYEGATPAVYLSGPKAKFNKNKGSGGDFVVTGAVQDAKSYKPVKLATP